MLASVLPASSFIYITCLSTLCKTVCGVSAGATKSAITSHFAIQGNIAGEYSVSFFHVDCCVLSSQTLTLQREIRFVHKGRNTRNCGYIAGIVVRSCLRPVKIGRAHV